MIGNRAVGRLRELRTNRHQSSHIRLSSFQPRVPATGFADYSSEQKQKSPVASQLRGFFYIWRRDRDSPNQPTKPFKIKSYKALMRFCYKFLLQIQTKTSYIFRYPNPPISDENGKRKPRFTVRHLARPPKHPEGRSPRLEPKRVHRIAQNRQQARSSGKEIGVPTRMETGHSERSATHCRANPRPPARNVI